MPPSLQVMIIGSGGREHALAWKLIQSPMVNHVYVVPGNAGIAQMHGCVSTVGGFDVDDHLALVFLAEELRIGLVVVGLGSAIVGGIREWFDKVRIPCFAPSTKAAELEGSKVFAKKFMQKFDIPTAEYATFSNYEEAVSYVSSVSHRIVIKADGLAAGQGVVLPHTKDEAVSVLKEILVDGRFGASGSSVVIEEFLDGEEISVSTFSDGHHTINLSIGQDHKRIFDYDKGPNTGGMGVYGPVPYVTSEIMDQIEHTILQPTFKGCRKQGHPFVGLLFTGVMLTKNGPKVLGYNARFGDPEAQAVVPLIDPKVDLASVMLACVKGCLHHIEIPLSPRYACNVVITVKGYPGRFGRGYVIKFKTPPHDCIVFHAGTKSIWGEFVTSGGRVFTVVGLGDTLAQAVKQAYLGVDSIRFEGMYYRKDIASRALVN